MNPLNEKIEKGEVLKGGYIFCGDMMLTECIAQIGYDVLWIDMEHTAIHKGKVLENLIAAKAGGTPAVVRIEANDPTLAKPILDMGPDGIIFPYIRSAAEAAAAVAACEYPMGGERGYGPLRAIDYGGKNALEYVTKNYRRTWRMIQIEHIDAVNDLENIVQTEGVDMYIVGPNDLAASMGHLGHIEHPDVVAACDKIGEVMNKHGKWFGVATFNNEEIIKAWVKRGAKVVFAGSDVDFIHNGAKQNLKLMKEYID